MNVLLIIADDMRPELGCYGIEDIVTPRLDSLAKQATVFQNAYCNIPVSGAPGQVCLQECILVTESFYCV